ncbi:bifunctional precorrin-2 dehydrogenase/sirohydrochlorin ferrochelatase [Candidatus Latescibacterota bacterium]
MTGRSLPPSPAGNPYFQIGLDVRRRPCLVIGGGSEAEDKVGRLLDAGASVTLVSPRTTDQLSDWAAEGVIAHRNRTFEPNDLTDVFVVINTVAHDADLGRQVYELSRTRGCLVNSHDCPDLSDFGMASLVAAGHLRISISTSNASPSLAARIRQGLEQLFDGEFVDYLEQLDRVRGHLKATVTDRRRRLDLLRTVVADFRLTGSISYPEEWREQMGSLLE